MNRYDYMDKQETHGVVVITYTDTNGLSKAQNDILNEGWLIENVDFSPSRAYFYVQKKCSNEQNKQVNKKDNKNCIHGISLTTSFGSPDDSIQLHSAEKGNYVDEWTRLMFRDF